MGYILKAQSGIRSVKGETVFFCRKSISKKEKAEDFSVQRFENYAIILIVSERYRSGHNEADSKSVSRPRHVGSNPTRSAIYLDGLRKNRCMESALP